jgi:hypothetical protein
MGAELLRLRHPALKRVFAVFDLYILCYADMFRSQEIAGEWPAFVSLFPLDAALDLRSRHRSMAIQNPSTRANIAIVLAILFLSFSVLSSFKRQIRFSGPPQSISTKYEAASSKHFDCQQITFANPSITLDDPPTVCLDVVAVYEEDWKELWFSTSHYVRPPPYALT